MASCPGFEPLRGLQRGGGRLERALEGIDVGWVGDDSAELGERLCHRYHRSGVETTDERLEGGVDPAPGQVEGRLALPEGPAQSCQARNVLRSDLGRVQGAFESVVSLASADNRCEQL